jgi:predicted transcriptional regulator
METLDNMGIKLLVLCSASVSALQIVFSDSLHECIFKEDIVGAHLGGASVTKTATVLGVSRAAVSTVVRTYTNHGRTSSVKRNSSLKSKLSGRDRHTLKRIVSINHRSTAAKVTAELYNHLENHFHKKSDKSFTNPTYMVELQSLNLLLLKTALKCEKDGVIITKSGRLIGHT